MHKDDIASFGVAYHVIGHVITVAVFPVFRIDRPHDLRHVDRIDDCLIGCAVWWTHNFRCDTCMIENFGVCPRDVGCCCSRTYRCEVVVTPAVVSKLVTTVTNLSDGVGILRDAVSYHKKRGFGVVSGQVIK